MTIHTTQKLIKIGSSQGVTIPAKLLRELGVKQGDEIKIVAEAASPQQDKLMDEYGAFVKQYGQTLKNLADR